jgi:hypothetical protein
MKPSVPIEKAPRVNQRSELSELDIDANIKKRDSDELCGFRNRRYTQTNAQDGSAMPRRITDPSACVWPVKCGVVVLDVVEIDGAERRRRLLQSRAGLNLDKITFEIITAGKGGDDLIALLWRVLIISNPDDVHENTRVCERDFRSHVLGDTGRGV